MEQTIEKKFRILIVDDNPFFVKLFTKLINTTLGNNLGLVEVANNGKQGLDKIKEKEFDYIFMDVDMPVMDGIKATNLASKDFRGLNIVALTFHNELNVIQEMLMAGARNYINKTKINSNSIKKIFELSIQ